jgi:hypothetical protein
VNGDSLPVDEHLPREVGVGEPGQICFQGVPAATPVAEDLLGGVLAVGSHSAPRLRHGFSPSLSRKPVNRETR